MSDLWRALAAQSKPVVLYGMGNGADKILSVFSSFGIKAAGVFASDGFARGNVYAGHRVVTYGEMCERFDDFIVVVAFASSRPEVIANLRRIAAEREVVVPDVPVAGGGLFDFEFYTAHKARLDAARACLADDRSREVFDLVCEARLTGGVAPLFDSADSAATVEATPRYSRYRAFVDVGAYTGDTLRAVAARAPLERAWAVEPDRRSFAKLERTAAELGFPVLCARGAAWDERGVKLGFNDGAGRGSGVETDTNTAAVTSVTVDSLVGGERVDYIKYDVEGAEARALDGSAATVKRCSPDLRVALYHRPEDIFALTLKVRAMLPRHSLFLRRGASFPAWDLDLFAVDM